MPGKQALCQGYAALRARMQCKQKKVGLAWKNTPVPGPDQLVREKGPFLCHQFMGGAQLGWQVKVALPWSA